MLFDLLRILVYSKDSCKYAVVGHHLSFSVQLLDISGLWDIYMVYHVKMPLFNLVVSTFELRKLCSWKEHEPLWISSQRRFNTRARSDAQNHRSFAKPIAFNKWQITEDQSFSSVKKRNNDFWSVPNFKRVELWFYQLHCTSCSTRTA